MGDSKAASQSKQIDHVGDARIPLVFRAGKEDFRCLSISVAPLEWLEPNIAMVARNT